MSVTSQSSFSGPREKSSVGLVLRNRKIELIVEFSSAERNGTLHIGDELVRIDDIEVKNDNMLHSLGGAIGTMVKLCFRRKGVEDLHTVFLEREALWSREKPSQEFQRVKQLLEKTESEKSELMHELEVATDIMTRTSQFSHRGSVTEATQARQLLELNEELERFKETNAQLQAQIGTSDQMQQVEKVFLLRNQELEKIARDLQASLEEKDRAISEAEKNFVQKIQEFEERFETAQALQSQRQFERQKEEMGRMREHVQTLMFELENKSTQWALEKVDLCQRLSEREGQLEGQLQAAHNLNRELSLRIRNLEDKFEIAENSERAAAAERLNFISKIRSLEEELEHVSLRNRAMEYEFEQKLEEMRETNKEDTRIKASLQEEIELFSNKVEIELRKRADIMEECVSHQRQLYADDLKKILRELELCDSVTSVELGLDNFKNHRDDLAVLSDEILSRIQRITEEKNSVDEQTVHQAKLILNIDHENRDNLTQIKYLSETVQTQARQLLELNDELKILKVAAEGLASAKNGHAEAMAQLAKLEAQLTAAESRDKKSSAAVASLTSQRDQLASENSDLNERNNSLRDLVSELEARIENKKQKLAKLKAENLKISAEYGLVKSDAEGMQRRVREFQLRIESLSDFEFQLGQVNDDFQKTKNIHQNEIAELERTLHGQNRRMTEERETWRVRVATLEERLKQTEGACEDRIKDVITKMQSLSHNKGEADGRAEEYLRQLRICEGDLREYKRRLQEGDRNLALFQSTIDSQENQIFQLNVSVRQLRDALYEAQLAVNELQPQNDSTGSVLI